MPVRRENSDTDPADQNCGSQGSPLIASRRVTKWVSEYKQMQEIRGIQGKKRRETRQDNSVFIFMISA